MPIVVVLMLISIITTIIIGSGLVRPTEMGELNKNIDTNEEKIEAATTVNAGDTYTVPEDGVYKIELHGGHGGGVHGRQR